MASLNSPRWWFFWDVWKLLPSGVWSRVHHDGPGYETEVGAKAKLGGNGTHFKSYLEGWELKREKGVSRAHVWNGYRWDVWAQNWYGYE